MPLLHIEADTLSTLSHRLLQMAEEIDWQIQRIENRSRILQATWQGDGSFQFEAELDQHLLTLRRLSHEIIEISLRLQHEIVKWEGIGHRF